MSLIRPDHMLTLDEWEALPESNELRLELAEGMLVGVPKPLGIDHGRDLTVAGHPVTVDLAALTPR